MYVHYVYVATQAESCGGAERPLAVRKNSNAHTV